MRALKFVVIVMGLAIVIGTTVLITVIAERAGMLAGGGPGPQEAAAPKAPVTAAIRLPAGARVVESRLDGGRILLRLSLAGGDERVIVVDAATGRVSGTYDLVTGEDAKGKP